MIIAHFDQPDWNRHRLVTGVVLSILKATVFVVARQPYAGIVCFSFLVIKGFLAHESVKKQAKVRLRFIWEAENIATNTPGIYREYMPVFEKLLRDSDDRVRMEAPEIFRVLGKRRPEFVRPYVERLQIITETDTNQVVRIHCLGRSRRHYQNRQISKEQRNQSDMTGSASFY